MLSISVGTHLYQTESTFNKTCAAPSLLLLHVPCGECEFMHRNSLLPEKPLKAQVSKTGFAEENKTNFKGKKKINTKWELFKLGKGEDTI